MEKSEKTASSTNQATWREPFANHGIHTNHCSSICLNRRKQIGSYIPICMILISQLMASVPNTYAIRFPTSKLIDRHSNCKETQDSQELDNNHFLPSLNWNLFRGGHADFIEDADGDLEQFNYHRQQQQQSNQYTPTSQEQNFEARQQHQLEQRDYPYANPNQNMDQRSSNNQGQPWKDSSMDRREPNPNTQSPPDFPDDNDAPPFPMDQRQQMPPPLPQRSYPNRRQPPSNRQPQRQVQQSRRPPPQPPIQDEQGTQSAPPLLDLEDFDKDLIFEGLKRMYRKKILPLEVSSRYGHFHSKPLSPPDFDSKPMVLLLGQYSVGKTSFIKYLLGRDFPGIRIGPEPTTDRFTTIMDGDVDKIIPGAALCSQSDRPFRGLNPFGNNFLSRFEGVEMDAPILHNITLVDTPGILSGTKQSDGRNYDYDAVMKWFAERADLIIIMFDAHKLDISDELKRVIEMMSPHADKVRVVLNKADSVSTQQLMRVYGALMWSLGKVMLTPEVCRVYIGSFWSSPTRNVQQRALLEQEKLDLFHDIAQLPQNAVMRRINELVKRARSVKVHAYIIHYLRKQLPYTWGKRETQARLIRNLDREFVMCARRYELPRGDFPPVEPMRKILLEIKDLSEFKKLDKNMVKDMDKVFTVDIPQLLEKARGH